MGTTTGLGKLSTGSQKIKAKWGSGATPLCFKPVVLGQPQCLGLWPGQIEMLIAEQKTLYGHVPLISAFPKPLWLRDFRDPD